MSINPLNMAVEVSESDEREDGEIVDDDFEEISDYSIPSCGKSDSSQDLLRAISLSSISGSDGERARNKKHYLPPCKKRRKHHDHHHKKKRKKEDLYTRYTYSKKRRRKNSTSDDSDMERLDRRTLRQLREAVRINTSTELTTNSLRSRLKAMIDPDSDEEDLDTLRTLALLTSKNENNIDDSLVNKADIQDISINNDELIEEIDKTYDKELEELRLEALKSAVMKKHIDRKRRKEMLNKVSTESVVIVSNHEINKENTESNNINENIEPVIKDQKLIVPVVIDIENNGDNIKNNEYVKTVEEDIDIMRAMLLASMSTKITTIPNKLESVNNKKSPPILNQSNKKILKPNLAIKNNQVKTIQNIRLPSVKPLIININNDSDTESDIDKMPPEPVHNIPIDKSVTEFLRKQREQFEAKQLLPKPIIKQKENKEIESILDKSVVKLLSKSQQKEYRYLQQKLIDANTKRRIRRLSIKLRNNKEEVASIEEKRNPSELKKTLQDLQTHKNGRLQMKGKYRDLAPLLQNVNEASNKRKLCEGTIKKLLGQLQTARNELASSHEKFTDLVQELIKCKETIDTCLIINTPTIYTKTLQSCATIIPTQTSTPIKPAPAQNFVNVAKDDTSKLIEDNLKNAKERLKLIAEKVDEVVNTEENLKTSKEIDFKHAKNKLNECITENNVNSVENCIQTDEDITELKTNSVESIEAESCIAKYVSPLDNRSCQTTNPLEMLCPYELFGVCKDQDCKFNHCP